MPPRGLLLGILVLAACGQVETEPTTSMGVASASPTAGDARTTGWRSDLELLISERERIHPEPWHGIDRAEYVAAVEAVSARVPNLDDDELLVEITRLAAMPTWAGRDGHGGIHPWGEGTYGVHLYPLRLYRFRDGLFVTDALAPHVDHIGARVTHVNGSPVERVLEAVAPLVPRDNEQQVLTHGPRLMLAAEVLHGLGFLDDPGEPVDFTFVRDGADEAVALEPIPLAEYEEWAGGHHSMSPPPRSDGPAWIRQPTVPIWWELQDDGTAYVQYNFTLPVGDIVDEVAAAVQDGSAERVVVDLRHNPGGNNGTYGPLVSLLGSPEINRPGRLYVIMGRATFSAAGNFVTEVELKTDATLVGEDSGTSPNQYGDSIQVVLDHSGLILRVAPQYIVRGDPDDARVTIQPDIAAPLSSGDYFGDRDPAMEAILADA